MMESWEEIASGARPPADSLICLWTPDVGYQFAGGLSVDEALKTVAEAAKEDPPRALAAPTHYTVLLVAPQTQPTAVGDLRLSGSERTVEIGGGTVTMTGDARLLVDDVAL